jgi:hypothetical protein
MTGNENKMIACCGLTCSDCPAYIATKAGDADKIAEIADNWAKVYNVKDIKPDAVWCDGCTVGCRKCGHCSECVIRACVMSKSLANCGLCGEMDGCELIQSFFKMAPAAKSVIENISGNR